MRNTKRFLLLFTAVMMLVTLFSVAVMAASGDVLTNDPDNSNDLVWFFDEATGVLTISGTSSELKLDPKPSWNAMSSETIPWYAVKDNIKTVVITAPITSICGYAFNQLTNCETMIFPADKTIKLTGSMTFANAPALTTFGPEGTAVGVIDLRNFTGESSQCFENSCLNSPVTVLMPYGDELPINDKKVFGNASDITFRVSAGTKCEELVKTIKATAESASNPSPYADKVTIEYYTGTNDDAPAGGAADTTAKVEDTTAPTGGETAGNPNAIIAQDEIVSQYANLTWVLTADGTITFTPTKDGWNEVPYNTTNDNRWYSYKDQIKKAVIKSGLNKVGAGAFKDCVNLEIVEFGSIGQIASEAFSNCPKLTTIYKAGNDPVEGVFDLTGVYTYEGANQFVNCGMTTLNLQSSVTALAENRFVDCAYLTNVTFGEKIETINDSAFSGCYNLKVVFGVKGSAAETFATNNGMTFAEVGAEVEIPEAVVTTAAPETTTPAPETTKAPETSATASDTTGADPDSATQTGDINIVMIVAFAVAALGSAVVLSRKRRFN